MYAGGQSFDGCGSRDKNGMIPSVSGLKNCLLLKGWRSYHSQPHNFKVGYPIFLKRSSHVMIATGFSGGKFVYCAHTQDVCDRAINPDSVDFFSL